jgi:hypothetical protein
VQPPAPQEVTRRPPYARKSKHVSSPASKPHAHVRPTSASRSPYPRERACNTRLVAQLAALVGLSAARSGRPRRCIMAPPHRHPAFYLAMSDYRRRIFNHDCYEPQAMPAPSATHVDAPCPGGRPRLSPPERRGAYPLCSRIRK